MLFEESGIEPEVVEARGYRTVEKKVELEELGFGRTQRNVPALLIPVYSPRGEVALPTSPVPTSRGSRTANPSSTRRPSGSQHDDRRAPLYARQAGRPFRSALRSPRA